MNQLVYATGSQVTPDKSAEETKTSKNPLNSLNLIGMLTAGIAAYNALAATDLAKIGKDLISVVKNPFVAAALAAVFVYMNTAGVKE